MSEMSFWLALYGKNINLSEIENLLQIELDNNRMRAPKDLPEDPDGPIFYKEIAWLLDMAEKNKEKLTELGVAFSECEIWMIYYYDKQCNMEFAPDLMERMGKLGIKLCVSCQG